MKDKIEVKVVEGFCEYNHNGTVLICDVNEGDVITATLNEATDEYFGEDMHGRKVYVGELDFEGNLHLSEGFELNI